jgi:NTE family protein
LNGVALVLAGGGGKGAYHIGVWKALREFGVDKNISAVAGTSVGSLNAALFMQGDYDLAEKIWLTLSHDKLLTVSPNKIVTTLVGLGFGSIFSMSQILGFATMFSQHGVFSRDGMKQIINDNLNSEYISSSNITGFATCCELPFFSTTYFSLNNCSSNRLQSILLASSALPIIYGAEEIDGNKYVDGGLRDNLPIKPLYDEGYRQIIVVHLNREDTIEHSSFPEANIIEILPTNHQGDFINGTLDFSPEGAAKRIQEGYTDTVKIFKPIYEMGLVQQRIQATLQTMKNDETQFTSKQLLEERKTLKSEIESLLNNREVKNDTRTSTKKH